MIVRGRRCKNVIFHGNSLFNLAQDSITVENNHYCSRLIYSNLLAAGVKNINAVFLSINGNPTTTKIANWSTQTLPILRPGDVVILNEIQNDVSALGLSGLQAYNNYVTVSNLCRASGVKIVVGTASARNHTNDTDQFTRNLAANALVRADSTHFDCIVDVGADSRFSTQAACDDTDIYMTDKLHYANGGSIAVASLYSNGIINGGIL